MTNILIGKKITQMKIADDKEAILFICEDGEVSPWLLYHATKIFKSQMDALEYIKTEGVIPV